MGLFTDFFGPADPDEEQLPFTAAARALGVWVPPGPESSELPFTALARSLGLRPFPVADAEPLVQAGNTALVPAQTPNAVGDQLVQTQTNEPPIAEQTPADRTTAQSGERKDPDLTYPDGTPVVDPETGEPYPLPPRMDVPFNLELGKQIAPLGELVPLPEPVSRRDAFMAGWFRRGGPMDYKRPHGYWAAGSGDIHTKYRRVTYYNYGAVAAAAGYSEQDAVTAAGIYNFHGGGPSGKTPLSVTEDAEKSIRQGWHDAMDGKWSE